VTPPTPSNWQSSAKGVAATALVVAIALYIAVHLIEAVAPVLIGIGVVLAIAYAAVIVGRRRRSHW